jgi:hypothetical protein
MYRKDDVKEYSAQALPSYFFETDENGDPKIDACCWTVQTTADWLMQIGESIGHETMFATYRKDMLKVAYRVVRVQAGEFPLWDGMHVVDKSVVRASLTPVDGLTIPWRKHREILELYMTLMYTSHNAILCPGGLLCLQGVSTLTVPVDPETSNSKEKVLSSLPQACPRGSYCLRGSNQVIGTDLCPPGYYCPSQSVYPEATQPGSYASNFGSIRQQKCGYDQFQIDSRSTACKLCPSGF